MSNASPTRDALDDKVNRLFAGKVVRKDLVRKVKVGANGVEVSVSNGTGKLKLAGGVSGAMKESVQRAFSFLQTKKSELGVARDLDVSDLHIEVIDLLANRVEAELGVAFFVAAYSALRKTPVSPALLILGDLREQAKLPRRQRRHHGSRRSDLLRRREDRGDEGARRLTRSVSPIRSIRRA